MFSSLSTLLFPFCISASCVHSAFFSAVIRFLQWRWRVSPGSNFFTGYATEYSGEVGIFLEMNRRLLNVLSCRGLKLRTPGSCISATGEFFRLKCRVWQPWLAADNLLSLNSSCVLHFIVGAGASLNRTPSSPNGLH